MRRLSALIVLSIWYTGAAATVCRSGQEGGFAKFYADFQAAVKAGDQEKVASMTSFDDFYWEATDALRQVKTREAFLKNYDKMFTAAIKNKIVTTKPKKGEGATTRPCGIQLTSNTDSISNCKRAAASNSRVTLWDLIENQALIPACLSGLC